MYCIALDLLGHGRSPVDPDGDYSIEAQARRVLALADHLGLERFSIIGHSMGGQIALYIAACLAPQRVIKLIDVAGVVTGQTTTAMQNLVINPLIKIRGTILPRLLARFLRWAAVRFKPIAWLQFSVWWYDFHARDFDWWRRDRQFATRPGIHHTWYLAMDAFLNTDLTVYLPDIQCPTLVIIGREDEVIPVEEGQLVKQLVADSQMLTIPNCGHLPMYECPDNYLVKIQSFLLDDSAEV